MKVQFKTNGTIKIVKRKDGTIRIESIGKRERVGGYSRSEWHWLEYTPHPMFLCGDGDEKEVTVGMEGCLAIGYNVIGDEDIDVWLVNSGVPGNAGDGERLHGWRGTTNDRSVAADGWRRVESITPRKRGLGWVAILSKDLRPDEK